MGSNWIQSTEERVQKVKQLLEGASIQEPAYDPVCAECARILKHILFDEERLLVLMNDLKNWEEEVLYDLYVVIDEWTHWSDEERDSVPLRLFLYLFINLDIENYDVMLDTFSDCNRNEEVETSTLLKVQDRLQHIKEHYPLDEYLEGWWKHAVKRIDQLLADKIVS